MDNELRFTLEFPLELTPWKVSILSKRFEIAKKLYNTLLHEEDKKIKEMRKTKAYRSAKEMRDDKDELTPEAKRILNDLRVQYKISKNEFEKDLKKHRKFYKKQIDSQAGQVIADRAWTAFEDTEFGDGEIMHYKRYNDMNTISGKTYKTGIKYNGNNTITWNGILLPFIVKTDYEKDSLKNNEVAYCMIKRRIYKNKTKYFAVLVFKGKPPVKYDKNTGEVKHQLGVGKVGLDPGTATIAIVSDRETTIHELAPSAQGHEKELRRIQRAMDRSRRATNPNNYNADGTPKTGAKNWNYSKRYIELSKQSRFLQTKLANIKDYEHCLEVLYILSLGNKFFVETMDYEQMKERKKEETEIDPVTKRCKKKKRFGKTIGNRAPAKLLTKLENKLALRGVQLVKINTYEAKASQFNHFDLTCTKKKLSQRWNNFEGMKIQRDLYSAFLIKHINDDLCTFNVGECNKDFMKFKKLHDEAVAELEATNKMKQLRVM